MEMTDGEIEIHSIDTIDDYYKIGDKHPSAAVLPNITLKRIH